MHKLFILFKFYHFKILIIIFRNVYFIIMQKFFKKESLVANVYDYKMHIPLKYDGIGKVLYCLGGRELDHKWMIDKIVKQGDTILDLGVNIGYYAIMEAKKMKGIGKIYAIEPDPRNIEFLKKNIILNNIENLIEFEQGAISNKNGEAEFILSNKTNLNAFALEEKNSSAINVSLYDFGDYLKNKDRIDLVRMDIEGHEIEVFESLYNFWQKKPNMIPKKIIFETHLKVYKKSKKMAEILEKLFFIGYSIQYLSSSSEDTTLLKEFGYQPFKVLKDYPFIRGIYKNIKKQDVIKLITDTGGVRTVVLSLNK